MGQSQGRSSGDAHADRSADRLAVALEEVGFDVGRAFPLLRGVVGRDGSPVVELGSVTGAVADQLSGVLAQAAAHGATVPIRPPGGSGSGLGH